MKHYRVLVIEDSQAFCKLINRKLHEYRIAIEATFCHTYAAAKQLLDEEHQNFDVAIVDLNLPDAPSGAAIELVHHWDISVVVFTVHFDDVTRQSFIQQGVADYILKQGRYNLDYLGRCVHRFLLNPDLTALIIRNNKASCEALADLVHTQRLKVETAFSGAEALALIERDPNAIDIVIMDYDLIDTRGDQLSVAIRHLDNHDPIQILGILDAKATSMAPTFLKAGATDLIMDPFEPEELYSRLGQIADNIETIAELRRLNIEKNRFVGMTAHDLRNPLNIISNATQLMHKKRLDEDKHQEVLSIIDNQVDHMKGLLNALLNIASIESGQLVIDPHPFNLVDIVEKRLQVFAEPSASKSIDLVLNTDTQVMMVILDRGLCAQVFDNLISNALKYSPFGSKVWVKLLKTGETVRVQVWDSGPGILPKEEDQLFEPFTKLSTPATGGESKHGLGLSICKKIMEAHGGHVEYLREQGHTHFDAVFPLSDSL